jgi:hypothetical protein
VTGSVYSNTVLYSIYRVSSKPTNTRHFIYAISSEFARMVCSINGTSSELAIIVCVTFMEYIANLR